MGAGDEFTGPVNLGNPGEFTILELAKKVIQLTNSVSHIEYQPLPQDDPVKRRPDIRLAQTMLGWSPVISLDIGLEKTIAYFKEAWEKMKLNPPQFGLASDDSKVKRMLWWLIVTYPSPGMVSNEELI